MMMRHYNDDIKQDIDNTLSIDTFVDIIHWCHTNSKLLTYADCSYMFTNNSGCVLTADCCCIRLMMLLLL